MPVWRELFAVSALVLGVVSSCRAGGTQGGARGLSPDGGTGRRAGRVARGRRARVGRPLRRGRSNPVFGRRGDAPQVEFLTSMGRFRVVLFPEEAPRAVRRFLDLVARGAYQGTIFHRVVPGVLVQGGSFDSRLKRRKLGRPLVVETENGLANLRGTLALAHLDADPHSADGEFFVNLRDNRAFDRRGPGPAERGYAVFGRVLSGLEVLDAMSRLRICPRPPSLLDLPCRPVRIVSVRVLQGGSGP